jgi:hypothetical protein
MTPADARRAAWPPTPRQSQVLTTVAGALLALYGFWAIAASISLGPGGHDAVVESGLATIPWYGLSAAGLLAALASLWWTANRRLRIASTSVLLAVTTLAGWTAMIALSG